VNDHVAQVAIKVSPSKMGFFREREPEVFESLEEVKQQKGDEWSGYRYTN